MAIKYDVNETGKEMDINGQTVTLDYAKESRHLIRLNSI